MHYPQRSGVLDVLDVGEDAIGGRRNVATFGEPGGVVLMGPGACVGGWGVYGRCGGDRGRRNPQAQV